VAVAGWGREETSWISLCAIMEKKGLKQFNIKIEKKHERRTRRNPFIIVGKFYLMAFHFHFPLNFPYCIPA
jgi:hypothetical protein